MTCIIATTSKRSLSAKLAAGLAIAAILTVGTFSGPADARDSRDYNRHGYNGGYYRAPPVVYGSRYNNGYYGSYYHAPPVVFLNLGNIGIGIR
jgi:hypothetical protein